MGLRRGRGFAESERCMGVPVLKSRCPMQVRR